MTPEELETNYCALYRWIKKLEARIAELEKQLAPKKKRKKGKA